MGFYIEQRRPVQTIQSTNQKPPSFAALESDDRRADRVGTNRRAQRECSTRRRVVLGALQDQIPTHPVQPIEHIELGITLDSRLSFIPGLDNNNFANWSVGLALTRTFLPRVPRRPNLANKDKRGIARAAPHDRSFAGSHFIILKHGQL